MLDICPSYSSKEPTARRDKYPVLRKFVYDPASTHILIVYQEPINVESTTQTRHVAVLSKLYTSLWHCSAKTLFSPISLSLDDV